VPAAYWWARQLDNEWDARARAHPTAEYGLTVAAASQLPGRNWRGAASNEQDTNNSDPAEVSMKRLQLLLALSGIAVLGATASAFGQSAQSRAAQAVITTKSTSLGTILVNSSGQTLYLDVGDKPGHFVCTGQCAAAWPSVTTSGKPKAAGKAKAADLGTVKHGKLTQVTYNGHPLYTFTADSKSAPTSGEGVNGFYVVSPSGNKITKAPKTTTTTTTSSSTTSSRYGY
jgi:predicted lipoprotein with Yx(FWY)xxD motif